MLRDKWYTLSETSHVTITEKKSEFIADAAPIGSAAEAEAFLGDIRRKYPDARHHVYAWRLGGDEILQRYSDDGEPAGTAGLPVLDVLRKNQIDDAIIVVTRYFGGVLLGTGGLVRAYGKAAFLALKEAVPSLRIKCGCYMVMIAYSSLDKLLFALQKAGFLAEAPQFGMDPVIPVFCTAERKDELIRLCMDLTAGQAVIEYAGERTVTAERLVDLAYE